MKREIRKYDYDRILTLSLLLTLSEHRIRTRGVDILNVPFDGGFPGIHPSKGLLGMANGPL